MSFLFDIHCHLDFKVIGEKYNDLDNRLNKNKIISFTNTLNKKNYIDTKKMFSKSKNIFVLPGLYPQEAEKISDKDFELYIKFLKKNKDDFIAIGEVGLDLKHTKKGELFDKQIERFRKMIELSIEVDKPIIIHTREAENKVIEIIEEYRSKYEYDKFIFHCFMGKKKLISKIKELNIKCSIPYIIYTNDCFVNLVKELKTENIFVETDSPYLGLKNDFPNTSLVIPKIYEKIAEVKNLKLKEVEKQIEKNVLEVFKFKT